MTSTNKVALIKLTEERINNNTELQTFVDKARALTNPIFPETVQFTDTALKFGAALITVDLKLDKYGNNRDVYRNESGGYCLHLSKLNEIAQQSGITITDSRILERKTDERGRVTFISHQVKGKFKSVDGSIKEDVATGKYDYFRDLEKYSSDKQVKSRRNHAEALAESNAKTRLFNKLVAKLPSSFTLDELKKPFLIPYVIEDKDELLKSLPKSEQDKIKSELVRKRLGITSKIYGGPEEHQSSQDRIIEDAEVTSVETGNTESEITPEEQNKINAETFREAPQSERTDVILNLCKKHEIKSKSGTEITAAMVEKSSIDDQIKFIEKLYNMESQAVGEELPL